MIISVLFLNVSPCPRDELPNDRGISPGWVVKSYQIVCSLKETAYVYILSII